MGGLKTSQVAMMCGCHFQTVLNYCKRGLVTPARDVNNHRRFSQADVEKLKRILQARWPVTGKQA